MIANDMCVGQASRRPVSPSGSSTGTWWHSRKPSNEDNTTVSGTVCNMDSDDGMGSWFLLREGFKFLKSVHKRILPDCLRARFKLENQVC